MVGVDSRELELLQDFLLRRRSSSPDDHSPGFHCQDSSESWYLPVEDVIAIARPQYVLVDSGSRHSDAQSLLEKPLHV